MSPFNAYAYKPLCSKDAIRLIVLDPARDHDATLSCFMVQRRRSEQTKPYSAISYAWGEPNFSRDLKVRCDDNTSYLRITPNVEDLLRCLRAPYKPRYLWIDAICLDQANTAEKAQQVPLMGRIYEEAKNVHIWLGPDDNMTAKIFETFREVSRLTEPGRQQMSNSVNLLIKKLPGRDYFGGGTVDVIDFFRGRSWFSRRWVIQEACLARQAIVHCGSNSIPLPWLALAATRLQADLLAEYETNMMASLHKPKIKPSILELLWDFHEADCLEPKDRIAALVGLVPYHVRPPLEYTAHWTDIYKGVASFMYGLGDNDIGLQMLCHLFEFGPVSRSDGISYPSWVPNWSRIRHFRRLPCHSKMWDPDSDARYPTSPGISQYATLALDHGTLQIHWPTSMGGPQGQQVALAKQFDPTFRSKTQRIERLMNILYELFPSSSGSLVQIHALSSLLDILIWFQHPSSSDARWRSALIDVYEGFIDEKLPKSLPAEVLRTLEQIERNLENSWLFKLHPYQPMSESSGGGWGIAYQQIQVGDMLIPLWQLEWLPGEDHISGGRLAIRTVTHTTTMLVVRPLGQQLPQHEISGSGVTGKAISVQRGSIIGPAVCILPENNGSSEQDLSVNESWDSNLDREQLYSMTLV